VGVDLRWLVRDGGRRGVVVRSRWVVEVWGVVWGVVERGANADVCPMREARIVRIVNALILLFVLL